MNKDNSKAYPLIVKSRIITLGSIVAFLPFSITLCHLSLLLFLTCCLAEGEFINKGRLILQNPLAWILPVFFLLHVAGVFYSENASNAWANVDKKLALFFAPLIIVSASPFTKEETRKVMLVFVGACLIATVVCVFNVVLIPKGNGWNMGPIEPYLALHEDASGLWPYFSYIHLSSAIGLHPTYFALYLMVCIFIVLQTIPNKITRGVIVIYLLAFIVFLSSRIIIITTLLSLLIMAPQKKVLIGAVVVMIALIFLNPVSFYRNLQEYTLSNFRFPPSSYNNNPISIRTSLLWLGVEAVRETNPLFGAGTGDVKDTIAALADKYNIHNVLNTSDPHNQYLHTYIALGAIGLLTLLAAFITPLWMFFRLRDFALCAGMLAFMIVCLTESALELQKGIVFFSLAVSLAGNQMRGWSFSTKQPKYA